VQSSGSKIGGHHLVSGTLHCWRRGRRPILGGVIRNLGLGKGFTLLVPRRELIVISIVDALAYQNI